MAMKKKKFKVVPRFDYTTDPTTVKFGVVSTTPTPGMKGPDRFPLVLDPFTAALATYNREDVANINCLAIEARVQSEAYHDQAMALAEASAAGPASEAEPSSPGDNQG